MVAKLPKLAGYLSNKYHPLLKNNCFIFTETTVLAPDTEELPLSAQ
ncbi:hypothetical protein [Anabaena sp. CCY 9910]